MANIVQYWCVHELLTNVFCDGTYCLINAYAVQLFAEVDEAGLALTVLVLDRWFAIPCKLVVWHDAGFATGALFRSSRGPRAAVVAGGVGAVAAAGLVAAREYLSYNL